ncbi:hypothetical protein IFR05_016634 [Cadophora sp. M221]|nr:hypothetical protein IFR05_016634 [Cadophora sp. M221]
MDSLDTTMSTMSIRQFEVSRSFIRRPLHFLRRHARQILAFGLAFLFLDLVFTLQRSQPASKSIDPTHTNKERIYIASLHWNEASLIRKHWAPAVLNLVRYFGKENIYVSIVEGGSWDDTKEALTEFDLELEKLGVERTIELGNETHADVVNRPPEQTGWIDSPRGRKDLRRIPYLASLRNRAMEKLREFVARKNKKRIFDKVLWLNDVIFDTQDVLNLLSTNDGHYAAACALDFSSPPFFYDTFALRDSSGSPTISMTWPYFLSPLSRSSIQTQSPVPVQSCWNGMVIFDAAPFYAASPLQFRGLPDSLAKYHLEASECCLIHADNPLAVEKGVFVNPDVRVAYDAEARILVNPLNGHWPSLWEKIQGAWRIRWARFVGSFGRYFRRRLIADRLAKWEGGGTEVHLEAGRVCIVNEMQILVDNGWMHV